MSDRDVTTLLTKIGFLYLKKLGCTAIAPEIEVHQWLTKPCVDVLPPGADVEAALKKWHDENELSKNHHVIDLLGIGKAYVPLKKKPKPNSIFSGCANRVVPVIRGIEIKVSRSDFKRGFVHNGCNYNYLMVPKGLVDAAEVHPDIGIIQVDVEDFALKTFKTNGYYEDYDFSGVVLIQKPLKKNVPKAILKLCERQMLDSLTRQTKLWLVRELQQIPYPK